MANKIQVWKCDDCDSFCKISVYDDNEPFRCVYKENDGLEVNWQPTDEYEIKKKKGGIPDIPNVPPIPLPRKISGDVVTIEMMFKSVSESFDNLTKKIKEDSLRIKELINKSLSDGIKPDKPWPRNEDAPNCAVCRWKHSAVFICNAQAKNWCDQVYNNDECKTLFEPREGE
jgi:hypothetical protein